MPGSSEQAAAALMAFLPVLRKRPSMWRTSRSANPGSLLTRTGSGHRIQGRRYFQDNSSSPILMSRSWATSPGLSSQRPPAVIEDRPRDSGSWSSGQHLEERTRFRDLFERKTQQHRSSPAAFRGREGACLSEIQRDDLLRRRSVQRPDDGSDPWQAVAPAGSAWSSLISGGSPVVFIHSGHENGAITGYRKAADGWEAFVVHTQFITTSMNAFPTAQPAGIVLVTEAFPGH